MNNNIEKIKFGRLDIDDIFFDSLKRDYSNFVEWYNKKRESDIYCYKEQNNLKGLLVLKKETKKEDFNTIEPRMRINNKLKISTFKVECSDKNIIEEFINIIFNQASELKVEEIYFTIYDNGEEKRKLINLFKNLGFEYYGTKRDELVYIKYLNNEEVYNE